MSPYRIANVVSVVSLICSYIYLQSPFYYYESGTYLKGVSFGLFGLTLLFLNYYLKYRKGKYLVNTVAIEDQEQHYKSAFLKTAVISIITLIVGVVITFFYALSESFSGLSATDSIKKLLISVLSPVVAIVNYGLFIEYGRTLHRYFMVRNYILIGVILIFIYLFFNLNIF